MILGTPIYSGPCYMGGRKSFQMLVHKSAIPKNLGGFVALHVQTTRDATEEKKNWIGIGGPVLLDGEGNGWATFVDIGPMIRFLVEVPQGMDSSGITIEVIPEP